MYAVKEKSNGAPDVIFGVLFYWNCSDYHTGKRESTGEYPDESGAGGYFFGRRVESQGIVYAVSVEAGSGPFSAIAVDLHHYESMGVQGNYCMDGSRAWCPVKTFLSLVRDKRDGALGGCNYAPLSFLLYGVWSVISEF